jgi:hypothetical protein
VTNPTNDELKAIVAAAEKARREGTFSSGYADIAANHAEAMALELLGARALIEKTAASPDEIDASRARRYLAKYGEQGWNDAS